MKPRYAHVLTDDDMAKIEEAARKQTEDLYKRLAEAEWFIWLDEPPKVKDDETKI